VEERLALAGPRPRAHGWSGAALAQTLPEVIAVVTLHSALRRNIDNDGFID